MIQDCENLKSLHSNLLLRNELFTVASDFWKWRPVLIENLLPIYGKLIVYEYLKFLRYYAFTSGE